MDSDENRRREQEHKFRCFLEDMKEIQTPREGVASKLAKLARLDDILMRSPRPGGAEEFQPPEPFAPPVHYQRQPPKLCATARFLIEMPMYLAGAMCLTNPEPPSLPPCAGVSSNGMDFIAEETDSSESCFSELVVKPSDVGMRPSLWDVSYPDPERKFQRSRAAARVDQKASSSK